MQFALSQEECSSSSSDGSLFLHQPTLSSLDILFPPQRPTADDSCGVRVYMDGDDHQLYARRPGEFAKRRLLQTQQKPTQSDCRRWLTLRKFVIVSTVISRRTRCKCLIIRQRPADSRRRAAGSRRRLDARRPPRVSSDEY
ncbi:hypothetical protein EVAR_46518_1 [Eumeta japonica]|uniref:Uncharacterized protein n=1 Tax=Eumeta variegata TaxID=151549 RepID=A0A4C1WU57_EUMVA|nr:hypothetical protein EVAR_46518_1 [Eumeta japonica]